MNSTYNASGLPVTSRAKSSLLGHSLKAGLDPGLDPGLWTLHPSINGLFFTMTFTMAGLKSGILIDAFDF